MRAIESVILSESDGWIESVILSGSDGWIESVILSGSDGWIDSVILSGSDGWIDSVILSGSDGWIDSVILSGASRSFIARGAVEGPAIPSTCQYSLLTSHRSRTVPHPSVSISPKALASEVTQGFSLVPKPATKGGLHPLGYAFLYAAIESSRRTSKACQPPKPQIPNKHGHNRIA